MSGEMLPELQTADQSQQPHQQWERGDWGRGQVLRDWWRSVYIQQLASLIIIAEMWGEGKLQILVFSNHDIDEHNNDHILSCRDSV